MEPLQTIINEINDLFATSYTDADADTTLSALGGDSLDAAELGMNLEDIFEVELPDEDLLNFAPRQIAELVKGGDKWVTISA